MEDLKYVSVNKSYNRNAKSSRKRDPSQTLPKIQ